MTTDDRLRRDDADGRAPTGTVEEPIPVVLATDIGSDVDDTWALAQLLRTPELDLQLVLTETGEARYRGEVAAKLLERADRTDVPIGLGVEDGAMAADDRHQGPWVDDYDLESYPGTVHEDGVGAFVDLVAATESPVTVISIAPTPSVAAALDRDPELAESCRFVGMHGSFYIGYDGTPERDAETNVRVDPAAFRRVLAADWRDVLLTPLDTCGLLTLDGERYNAIWSATDDPLLRSVIENVCIFAPRVPWMPYEDFTRRSSTLFDSVAVDLARTESFVEVERARFDVTDDGLTVPGEGGEFEARVALEWADLDGFEAYLTETLLGR
ncbi:inosine/uridine-preferring nucleoside hydrolase [Salinarchaeum sp. Harcht-Bsk1]|uniref:nucleoside hydrolase n=1 Tax=Salinarchaeum sp. Harcht-Bsk1 TaxID=1333523 RepID=UPI00034248C5|nr:nucleoside hydrolase [Salinarchaeum sp. Harcht-Bsk1]AGN01073.1 inosine/uridine-preferring nucleoside hydrolase [Salinarchaeum sp. Harcht-Bsk1]